MAELIIINGPCGVGKSTAAELVHQQIPMSLLLDIDSQRRHYSHYREHPEQSSPMAQATSLAMGKVALVAGYDVVVEKMQYYPDWYGQWIDLGKQASDATFEFILWASLETVLKRCDQRGYG